MNLQKALVKFEMYFPFFLAFLLVAMFLALIASFTRAKMAESRFLKAMTKAIDNGGPVNVNIAHYSNSKDGNPAVTKSNAAPANSDKKA